MIGTPMLTKIVSFRGEKKTTLAKQSLQQANEGNVGTSSHQPKYVYITTHKHEPFSDRGVKKGFHREHANKTNAFEKDVHPTN